MLTQAELVWLLAAVAKGDQAAFERLYGATRAKLYGVLLRILGTPELADDVMQETYLKVWKMAGRFDPTIASPISHHATIPSNHQWLPVATTARIVMTGWAMIRPRHLLVLNSSTPSATSSAQPTCTDGIADS